MKENASPTQCQALVTYLHDNPEGITALEALTNLGIGRLAARVWELKKEGYAINERLIELPNGKRVARYTLQAVPQQTTVWKCTTCGKVVIPVKSSVADQYTFAGCTKCGKQVIARKVAQ